MEQKKQITFSLNNTWKWWLRHWNRLQDSWCKLVAIESSNPEMQMSFLNKNQWIQVFDRWDLSPAINSKTINADIIVVAALPEFSASSIKSYLVAWNKWKTIFVEKPIALKYAETEEIITLAQKYGIQIIMWGQTRFSETWQNLKFWKEIDIAKKFHHSPWVEKYWHANFNLMPHSATELYEILKKKSMSLSDIEILSVIAENRSKFSLWIENYKDSIFVRARIRNEVCITMDISQWLNPLFEEPLNQTSITNWDIKQLFVETKQQTSYTIGNSFKLKTPAEDTVAKQAWELISIAWKHWLHHVIDTQTEHKRILKIMHFIDRIHNFTN